MDGPHADLQININNYPSTATVLVKVLKPLMINAILDHMRVADKSQILATLRDCGGIGKLYAWQSSC